MIWGAAKYLASRAVAGLRYLLNGPPDHELYGEGFVAGYELGFQDGQRRAVHRALTKYGAKDAQRRAARDGRQ